MRIIKADSDKSQNGDRPDPADGGKPTRPEAALPPVVSWPGRELLADPITAAVLMAVWSGDQVVTVPSPPGAGKTRLTVYLAAALASRAGLRVAVAAQTRAQALDIARRLGALTGPGAAIGLVWRSGPRPDSGACPVILGGVNWPRAGGAVRVGTTAKWLLAEAETGSADVLIVDEAYQCTYADLGGLGAMANQVVCVGDPGQIAPVVTGDTARWAGSATGPHIPAPTALDSAHPEAVTTVALEHTWRLGPATTELVSEVFYPALPFTSRRPPEHIVYARAVLPEIAHGLIAVADGPTDPVIAATAVDRVRALIATAVYSTIGGVRPVTEQDVAVVVPHVAQACAIRAQLADHPEVLVGTANALQGLERAICVAVHPMAGKRETEEFALDPGRMCVMLSRHRAHLSMIIDRHSAAALAHNPDDAARMSERVLDHLRATPTF